MNTYKQQGGTPTHKKITALIERLPHLLLFLKILNEILQITIRK